MGRRIKIDLYTEEEKMKIWKKHYNEVHKINVNEKSKDKLIEIIRDLESENYVLRNDRNYYYELSRKADFYRNKAHVYKVELGRCVRKLTRIYKEVLAIGYLLHFAYDYDCRPEELVDSFKCL